MQLEVFVFNDPWIIYIILLAVGLEEVIFRSFLSTNGMKLIHWFMDHITRADFYIWIFPLFFFFTHIIVYGISIDSIVLSASMAIQIHMFGFLLVLHEKRNYYKQIFPRIRKRIKESTIRISEPHYFNLEWMI